MLRPLSELISSSILSLSHLAVHHVDTDVMISWSRGEEETARWESCADHLRTAGSHLLVIACGFSIKDRPARAGLVLEEEDWYTDKKEKKIFSHLRKSRRERLQSHIWLTASSYMTKYLHIFSYIRKFFLIYDFATAPIWISLYMRKILFSFYQCITHDFMW